MFSLNFSTKAIYGQNDHLSEMLPVNHPLKIQFFRSISGFQGFLHTQQNFCLQLLAHGSKVEVVLWFTNSDQVL